MQTFEKRDMPILHSQKKRKNEDINKNKLQEYKSEIETLKLEIESLKQNISEKVISDQEKTE